ncbi:hypothetical protein ACFWFI_08820 [Streptomyces sp. NPDC060209]|uniref:hypothetical protein n=1 Tax=Streptomyces sp. NPDC060209 TaxID=3347073 RepID=UPI0036501969
MGPPGAELTGGFTERTRPAPEPGAGHERTSHSGRPDRKPSVSPAPFTRCWTAGRLTLTGDGAALEVGDSQILFDVADPPPPAAVDGTWVEVRVERDSVSLYPCLL